MATNRGAYDPRQFLHYPDKDPFSEAAQRRLEDLVQDFLQTGIAFANGASLEDITAEKRGRRAELTHHVVTDLTEQEEAVTAVGESAEVADEEEEEEGEDDGEYGGEFSRVDKGKARDEREGPGLHGLWSRTDHVEAGKPLLGIIVDDAISLLSDNDSGNPDLDDGEDLYADAYEHENVFDEDLDDADREESSDSSPDIDLAHSRPSSSEQEIIYIGDSDEEHTSWKVFSGIEAEPRTFLEDLRGDQHEHDAGWDPEDVEWEVQPNVWDCKGQGRDEDDDGKEYDWHQTKGKESDDEEADFIVHDEDQEEGHNGFPHMSQARRFFIPVSLRDPCTISDTDKPPPGSTLHTSAAWGSQSPRMLEHGCGQTGKEAEPDREEERDRPPASSEPSEPTPRDLVSSLHHQNDTEANERDLRPESELVRLTKSPDPSSSVPADATQISFPRLPIRYPDVVVPEQATELTDCLPDTDLANEGLRVEIQHEDLPGQTIVSDTDLDETSRAFLTSMISPELLPSIIKLPSPESLDAFNLAPLEFTGADLEVPHTVEAPEPRSVVPNDAPSLTDAPAIAEDGSFEKPLVDGATISHPSTEPILHNTTELSRHLQEHDGVCEPMTHLGEGHLEVLQSSHDTHRTDVAAELFSEPSPQLQSPASAEMSVSDRSHQAPIETLFSTDGENEDFQSKGSTLLHPAVFDNREHLDAARCSPKPTTAIADRMSRDIETHSVASEDLHREEIDDQPIVTEVTSEYGEETQQIGHGEKGEEADEVLTRNPGDVIFSDYVVFELMSEDGRANSHEADQRGAEGGHVGISERVVPARLVSAVSAGSSTPPLSPTATVTNSSAADPSVATSDLSTFHPASLSVITSTGSPPPIHVPRRSPAPADIRRRPMSRVCVASDDEGGNSDEETALPDPRLPPEPTHLRIPVGVVGRSLGDDKEQAESTKVEPPTPHVRSDSEGSSLNGDIRDAHDAERIPLTLVASDAFSASQGKTVELTTLDTALTDSIECMATNNADHAPFKVDVESGEESTGELAYPYSPDHQNKEDGTGGASVSFSAQSLATPGDDGGTLQPPSSRPQTPRSSSEVRSRTVDGVQSAIGANEQDSSGPSLNDDIVRNIEVKPPDTIEDGPRVDTNGHSGSKLNGEEAAEILRSPSLEYSRTNDHEPVVIENELPIKPEHNLRSSTKSKGKGKGKIVPSPRKRSESPLPHTTIIVTANRSPLSRKRSRTSDIVFTPSKQPRLTRSTTARAVSNLSIGDATSTSAVPDDRSDVSVASSSSAVSRILGQMGSGSSSCTSMSSRSPSATSQQSPTNPERSFSAMPPPIRRYVPHSHHVPASLVSKNIDQQHATPVSHTSPPFSPIPSTPTQSTSTHKTRASCTDHKISFPGPDGLLYFLVPRCSLLDPEVEKDVSIVDCGVATEEEVQRAVGDLEAVGLDPNVLGVIRQLAGVQLMREGQVGYLPKPGERIRSRRRHRRSQVPPLSHARDVVTQVDLNDPSGTGSTRLAPLSLQSAPSPASSSGSSSFYATKMTRMGIHTREHVKGPATDHGVNETSSGEEEDNDKMLSPPPSPRPSPHPVRSPTAAVSRKRRLRIEDAAYKPDDDAMDTSTDAESVGTKKKSKGGLKRKRNEAAIEGEHLSAESGRTTPKRKRKRKDVDASSKQEEAIAGASEPRRKKHRLGLHPPI